MSSSTSGTETALAPRRLVETVGRRLIDERRGWAVLLALLPLLVLMLAPTGWNSNEYHYLPLGHRFVAPEAFGPHHAAFDQSHARFLSAWVIGTAVDALGYDGAQAALRWALVGLYAVALAALARALRLGVLEAVLVLALFRLAGEGLIGDEWLFQGVEAKSLAYPWVLLGLAAVLGGRGTAGLLALALATYFHFLVGGFWALAALAWLVLAGGPARAWQRPLLVYAVAVLPLVALIAREVLTAEFDVAELSLGQIIGSFRNPHHVSPFLSVESFKIWFDGIVATLATGLLAACLAVLGREGELRRLAIWLVLLHAYLVAMLAVSWFDRGTEVLAPFFVFRPSAVILLLSLAVAVRWWRDESGAGARVALPVLALVVAFAGALTDAASRANELVVEETMPASVAALRAAVEAEVPPGAVILVEPSGDGEFMWPTVALERLIDRPTLVNYKFVPSHPADVARWYRLITWREAVFAGACERLTEEPVDFLLYLEPPPADACGTPVWSGAGYWLRRVGPG